MKKIKIISTVLGTSLLLAACSSQENQENTEDLASKDNHTVELTDAAGHDLQLPKNPKEVAVFDYGQLDNLDALNLGEKVVATAGENLPDYLSEYDDLPRVGSLHEINIEQVVSMDPDLAIVANRSRDSFENLNEFIPTIDLSNHNEGNHFENTVFNFMNLGTIFDVEEESREIITSLESQMANLKNKAEQNGESALVLMYSEGSLSAYGPQSRFGLVHDNFGFPPADPNIEASNHGMEVSFEYVQEVDPDILFVIDRGQAIGENQADASSTFEENPLIQQTKAYQNNQLIYLEPAAWYLAAGGVQAFEQMMNDVSQAL